MAFETVGVRAVVDKLDQYLSGVNQMNTRTDQLIATVERLAQSSAKTNAALNQLADAYQRKATASRNAKQSDDEHLSVMQKIENQLKRNLSASLQFSGAFLIIKAQQALFEGLSQAIVGMNARLEQSTIAFTTMLGSARQAASFLSELQQFAATTPFEFPQLISATQRLLAFQVAAHDVIPLLTSIGDAVAGLGSGAQGIERVTLALGQMSAKGKVSGEELRQLAEAGIPGLKILADELNLTTAQVQELVSAGQVSSDTFIKAFQRFSELNFGGLMKQQEQTFLGSLSTIKDQLLLLSAEGFKPLFESIRDTTVAFSNFLKSPEAVKTAKDLGAAFQLLASQAELLVPILALITARLAGIVLGKVLTYFVTLGFLTDKLYLSFVLASKGVTTWSHALQLSAVNVLKAMGPIGLIVAAFTALDLALGVATGRGLTERILGIGKAASEAQGEIKRLNDRIESMTEVGVPRGEAQGIVSQDAARNLEEYVVQLRKAEQQQAQFNAIFSGASFVGLGFQNQMLGIAQALDLTADPFGDAKQNVQELTKYIIDNTKYAEELRAIYLQRPEFQEFFGEEFARRAAAESKTLLNQQIELANATPGLLRRTGEAFSELNQFVQDSQESGKEWARDLATAVAATEGKIKPDLKNIQAAFADFLESDQSRESLQKLLEKFGGGKNNALAKFFEGLTKDAEQGTKNVMSALQGLIPETDELFTEWLARLDQQAKDMANFSNNLRFIFAVLSKAGVEGAGDFIEVLEKAGPAVTAGVAGMIAIDPDAAIAKLEPIFKALGGAFSGKLSESIQQHEPTTQEAVKNSVTNAFTNAIAESETTILNRIAGFNAKVVNKFAEGIANINAASFGLANIEVTGPLPQDPTTPEPPVVAPPASESRGALDRLAREAEDAAEKARRAAEKAEREAEAAANKARREAEQAQREAEQAAREVARAFEQELELRLRTVAQTTSDNFSRFFNLFIAGFNVQAADVLGRIPESVQRLSVQLVLAEKAERAFNDSIFELGSSSDINAFDTLTRDVLDFGSTLDKFLRQTEDSARAASQVGGFAQLGQLAAEAYATGLINSAGIAGDAARRIVEAVQAEFEANITLFDNLAGNIADAIRTRNQKEEEEELEGLNDRKELFEEEAAAKKKSIDDQLEARLEGLAAEKDAVKDAVDAIKDEFEEEAEARIRALDAAKDALSENEPEFSSEAQEKAVNRQTQNIIDASNARIAALEREKQAIDDLARARENERKIQESQQKVTDLTKRLNDPNLSRAQRQALGRQIQEQQKNVQELRLRQQEEAADRAAKRAIDDRIEAERALQEQARRSAQDQIDGLKAAVEAQKKAYEENKKAQEKALEEEKRRIQDQLEERKEALDKEQKLRLEAIEAQEKAERKAAEARKELLDQQTKDIIASIDEQIKAIREIFEDLNSQASIDQQVLDLIQGGKVDEIAQLFTDAGKTPFQLSGLTLGQAFFTGFFENENSIDKVVSESIAAIRQGEANTEAILSGNTIGTNFVDGAIDVLPTQFDIMTDSTLTELGLLKDQAVPVAGENGTQVGISFVDGMINGVKIQTPALERAVQEAVSRGVAAAQATIDARSPSKVTERLIGIPFSQGIAVGILAGADEIERAAQQVVRIAPSLGQPGGSLVASASTIQAQSISGAISRSASGASVAQPVTQEVHEHHWTIQAWDHIDVQRNMGKLLRAFDQGARRRNTGPLGG